MLRPTQPTFARLLRRLDEAALAAFVADLWAARGWETETDGAAVIATHGSGDRQVLLCLPDGGWLPTLRRPPRRPDADAVVAADTAAGRALADELGAALVDPGALYDMVVHAIGEEAREELLAEHFGDDATTLDDRPAPFVVLGDRFRDALGPHREAVVSVVLVALVLVAGASLLADRPDTAPGADAGAGTSGFITDVPRPTAAPGPTAGTGSTATPDGTGRPTETATPPTPAESTVPLAEIDVGRGPDGWPMFGFDTARTGAHPSAAGPGPTAAALAVQHLRGPLVSSPAVVDGAVYAARYDGTLFALDALQLGVAWRARLDGTVTSSPAVANGTVYIAVIRGPAYSSEGDDAPGLYAFDAETGDLRWRVPFPTVVYSSPAVVDGTVFLATVDSSVHAVDVDSGERRWRRDANLSVIASPAVANGTVYIGDTGGWLYALDAGTGEIRWRRSAGGQMTASPAVVDGTVYTASIAGYVSASDAGTGADRWNRSLDGRIVGSPAVTNDTVYVGTLAGRLYALDAETGDVRWDRETPGAVYASPAVAGRTVYVGIRNGSLANESSTGSIAAFDARTGEGLWRLETAAPVVASPAVAGGNLYAGDYDGRLYRIVACRSSGSGEGNASGSNVWVIPPDRSRGGDENGARAPNCGGS